MDHKFGFKGFKSRYSKLLGSLMSDNVSDMNMNNKTTFYLLACRII